MQKVVMALVMWLSSGMALAETAALLVYKVWEPGVDPYFTRILVSEDFVRMDEGQDDTDFTLLDRSKEVIYNVSNEDRAVLVIAPELHEVPAAQSLVLEMSSEPDVLAPKVGGVTPLNVELLANKESCAHLVVLPGLMKQAVDGLRDFKQVLARVQASSLQVQPQIPQAPCDLATNIHAPTRALDLGLPLHERSQGRAQLLQDYAESYEVDAGVFALPENFRRMAMPSLPAI